MPMARLGSFVPMVRRVVVTTPLLGLLGPIGIALAQDGTPAPRGARDVILATTTSTQDSGLLDVLVPLFERQTGYHLKPIAVGSGAALKLGQEGEADVLLVHAPADEEAFMVAGYGVDRHLVFYNDFVIVGPMDDPAGVAGTASAVEALRKIAAAKVAFVSRGDDSGTNKKELALWQATGITPTGSWYVESGTGMGDTLNIASERDAYTLTDRGTYLALQSRLSLKVLVEGDEGLVNVYHVIAVNPAAHPAVNTAGAQAFVAFLLDPATQQVVGDFGRERFGQPLFTPCADDACGVEGAGTPAASPAAA